MSRHKTFGNEEKLSLILNLNNISEYIINKTGLCIKLCSQSKFAYSFINLDDVKLMSEVNKNMIQQFTIIFNKINISMIKKKFNNIDEFNHLYCVEIIKQFKIDNDKINDYYNKLFYDLSQVMFNKYIFTSLLCHNYYEHASEINSPESIWPPIVISIIFLVFIIFLLWCF